MSDSKKPTENPEVKPEDIADAVIVEESDEAAETPEEPETEAPVELTEPEDTADEVHDAEPAPEPEQPKPTPAPTPVVVRRVGFVPTLLGGVAAAAIGFGVAQYVLPDGWFGAGNDELKAELTAAMQAQAEADDQRLAALEARPDLSARIEAGEQAQTDLVGRLDGLAASVDELSARFTELEMRPIAEGASASAVAAYERELKAVQDAMAKQRAEIEAMAQQAAEQEANAEMTAHQAMLRSAVSRIQVALDTGAGFAEPLGDLLASGVDVPAALKDVANEGVRSMPQLQASFPQAARAALSAARKAEGGSGDIGSFLRNQLGVRSLAPKEGNDPDAILSRAEAALAEGRLTDTMAELEALSEEGRVELTGWMAQATSRAQAVVAAEALGLQVMSN
ncbi:COG4223 family protein [Thalassovita taeanensis]|uniref:Mitochondrial inner membrane protein n=1 Tax=Thalassovita taeanensis TaxID=657014 RepID=A0A1H9JGD1_9RHOB|nr:hypothetical protein [Thalassovita taeanensis]SEQ86061.1 hypothetical protein SAMN04488092_1153 [Thalassovita taeanensis]